mmetsp:Transcript_117161/g.331551  ORF Transcript_117161/g.331551 Transcript_117161/m.331551 type:complete len:708 (+) Transcript_117161:95-2218(+)
MVLFCNVESGLPLAKAQAFKTYFLLDIDGTLAHTDAVYKEVFVELLKPYGYEVDEEFYAKNVHGKVDADVFRSLLPKESTPEELLAVSKDKDARFCAKVRGGASAFRPIKNLVKLFEFAKQHGVACIAVSNAPRGACETVLVNLRAAIPGAAEMIRIEDLVVGAECTRAKPYPDPYIEGARRLGADLSDCIVFEDSRSGIAAGIAAGVRAVVGIRSSLTDDELCRAGCAASLKDWSELTPDFFYEHLTGTEDKMLIEPSAVLKEVDLLRSRLASDLGQSNNKQAAENGFAIEKISSPKTIFVPHLKATHRLDFAAEEDEDKALLRAEIKRLRARNKQLEAVIDHVRGAVQGAPVRRNTKRGAGRWHKASSGSEDEPVSTSREPLDSDSFVPVSVVVPLGGSRAAMRPLLRILGKEMILWMLASLRGLDLDAGDELVIVYNDALTDGRALERLVRAKYDDRIRFVAVRQPTVGAAETLLVGLQGLERARLALEGRAQSLANRPIVSWDGDLVYRSDVDVLANYRRMWSSRHTGACVAFPRLAPATKGRFSYCIADADWAISEVDARRKISDWANTGTYCFPDGAELEDAIKTLLRKGDGHYEVADVIHAMMGDSSGGTEKSGQSFHLMPIEADQFHSFATPAELVSFLATPNRALPTPTNSPKMSNLTAMPLGEDVKAMAMMHWMRADEATDLQVEETHFNESLPQRQ